MKREIKLERNQGSSHSGFLGLPREFRLDSIWNGSFRPRDTIIRSEMQMYPTSFLVGKRLGREYDQIWEDQYRSYSSGSGKR